MKKENEINCELPNGEEINEEQNLSNEIDDGCVILPESGKSLCCVPIIGQIEGHYLLPSNNKTTKYEHFLPKLVQIEENQNIKGVLFILNTVGGDIEAGLAIAELIAGMSKPTVSLVLGGCHSIGVPLAVAAKRSFIAPTAAMTIHPVRMNGLVLGVSQTFEYFNSIQQRIVGFVCRNSGISERRFTELMLNSGELVNDVGTLLDGNKAVAEKIIDRQGNLSEALKELKEMSENY